MSATEAVLPVASGSTPQQTRPARQRKPRRDRAPGETQQNGQQEAQQPQQRRRGGGGGGRGGVASEALLAMRPSSIAPSRPISSVEPSSAEVSAAEQPAPRGNQRSRGRGGQPRRDRTVNGRTFGGNLTNGDAQNAQLQADAPTFVPGQPLTNHQNQGQNQKGQRKTRQRRPSKSVAPDIATRTHEDIDHGHYECPICTSEVLRNSKVWSCKTCWTVFHLSCIKKWSTNEGSAAARQQSMENGDIPPPRQWRCPGCNLPKDTLPKAYTCWCEKEIDPRSEVGIPPHSCGNTCGKERVRKCPHPCELLCHAGPCPPCSHMSPTQTCFCAKHESTRRCIDTDYESGWSCGEICGDLMPCGEHTCSRPCHEGLCGACEVRVDARCYCGQVEKAILCCDSDEERVSQMKHIDDTKEEVNEEWTGTFACPNTCKRAFDCGEHHCEKSCHTQQSEPEHCPRSPDVITHCPCGKTKLSEITDSPRTSCQDPIKNCDKRCMKPLSCGHACEQLCHSGECLPCLKTVSISCRCGRTTSSTICHQGTVEPPQCMRVCRTTLSCGRHACDERCCPGERKAAERQTTKRKQRPIDHAPRPVEDGFEAEHICTRLCGRPLKCGNHFCEELCHKGPCGSCREAIFDEISCHCGRTVLTPPLPCGTQPPPCRMQCGRPKTCGHPQVQHNCHQDSESCPKCPFLVEKRCMCGKGLLKNQQCWLQDIRCGNICGRKLRCGSHFCRKPCHQPGECEDAGSSACQQPCGKPKNVCGHPDENICHAPYPCKEDKPCLSKIFITCDCQAQKQEMRCNASKSSEGNSTKSLACNDECARLERNRKLAVALNIDQSNHTDGGDHVPYSNETLALFQGHVKWGQTQEREFRVFADSDDEKRLRFKPMPAQQRAFLHHLAEDFGLDSESMDPEPHRHVAIFKTPRFVAAPNKTLAECLRIRVSQRALVQAGHLSDSESAKKTRKAQENGEPFDAFVITNPRFGLTVEEVRSELVSVMPPTSSMQFDIAFLPSEEVILKATSKSLSGMELEQFLKELKLTLATAIAGKALGKLQLCRTDASLNITRTESDPSVSDGWSRVAAKGAAPRVLNQQAPVRGSNSFSMLSGNKVTFVAKKKEKVVKAHKPVRLDVVEDWETAEMAEEEREKEKELKSESEMVVGRLGGSGGGGGGGLMGDTAVVMEAPQDEKRDDKEETMVAQPAVTGEVEAEAGHVDDVAVEETQKSSGTPGEEVASTKTSETEAEDAGVSGPVESEQPPQVVE